MKIIDQPKPGQRVLYQYAKPSRVVNRTALPAQILHDMVVMAGGVPDIGWSVTFSHSPRNGISGHCNKGHKRVLCTLGYGHWMGDVITKAEKIYRLILHEIYHIHDRGIQSTAGPFDNGRRPRWKDRPEEKRAKKREAKDLNDAEIGLIIDLAAAIEKYLIGTGESGR